MHRPILACVATAALVVAPTARACSCSGYPTQAEADAAGERVYAEADLIVEATVGARPDAYRRICFGPGGKPRPRDHGRTVSLARPFVIHRVLKGSPPARPVMAYESAEVTAYGCGILTKGCDEDPPENVRHVMVLRKVDGGRYRPVSLCARVALGNSQAGQALFKRAG